MPYRPSRFRKRPVTRSKSDHKNSKDPSKPNRLRDIVQKVPILKVKTPSSSSQIPKKLKPITPRIKLPNSSSQIPKKLKPIIPKIKRPYSGLQIPKKRGSIKVELNARKDRIIRNKTWQRLKEQQEQTQPETLTDDEKVSRLKELITKLFNRFSD